MFLGHDVSESTKTKICIKTPKEEKVIEVDENADIKQVIPPSRLIECRSVCFHNTPQNG